MARKGGGGKPTANARDQRQGDDENQEQFLVTARPGFF